MLGDHASSERQVAADGQLEGDLLAFVCNRGPKVPIAEIKQDFLHPDGVRCTHWTMFGCQHLRSDDVRVHGVFGRWMAKIDDGVARLVNGTLTQYTPVRWLFSI